MPFGFSSFFSSLVNPQLLFLFRRCFFSTLTPANAKCSVKNSNCFQFDFEIQNSLFLLMSKIPFYAFVNFQHTNVVFCSFPVHDFWLLSIMCLSKPFLVNHTIRNALSFTIAVVAALLQLYTSKDKCNKRTERVLTSIIASFKLI